MIEAKNLSITIDDKPILKNLNFSLKKGSLVSILGENGVGKTTLIKAIAGILPYEGSLTLDGAEIKSFSSKERAKRFSYLEQLQTTVFDLTVWEYVSFARYVHTDSFHDLSKEDLEIVDYYIDLLKLNAFRDRSLKALSGGERQRVMIASAFTQSTEILLLDEPISFLDISMRYEMLEEIVTLGKKEGKTILSVMHDIDLSDRYFDQALVLKEGTLYSYGPSQEVITPKMLQEVFSIDAEILEKDEERFFLISAKR
ncbi:ABC transporter ATP-binding protein [Guggenheimella bovis]